MKKRIKYIMIFLFLSSILIGKDQVVKTITIHGNNAYNKEILLNILTIQENKILPKDWSEKSLERLIDFYNREGYLLMNVDSVRTLNLIDTSMVQIDIWITENDLLTMGELVIKGLNHKEHRTFDRLARLQNGYIFHDVLLEEDIQQLLNLMENGGHPLGRVELHSLRINRDKRVQIDFELHVKKGPEVILDTVIVVGNEFTMRKVIIRESRLKQGMQYNHRKIRDAQFNLKKLGYFSEVHSPKVHFIGDRAVVKLVIKEGNTNTFDGILGYEPGKENTKKGVITGQIHFIFKNLLGTGRFLEAFWEKKSKETQAMRFGYTEPWLLGWPLNIGGWFQQEIRDTTYVERDWRILLNYHPWPSLDLKVEGGPKEILPDSMSSWTLGLAQTKSWILTLGFQYNTMDDPINPNSGIRYQTAVTFGRKRNIGPEYLINQEGWKSSVNTRILKLDAEFALSTWIRQVLFLGIHGHELKSTEKSIPLTDQIRFGGTTTVRGYKEDAFRGTKVAWINTEYRYLFGRYSRFFPFLDLGFYQRRENHNRIVRGVKIGYGFGMRLNTRLGIMGIDYGLGEGDGILQGKIHVRIANRF